MAPNFNGNLADLAKERKLEQPLKAVRNFCRPALQNERRSSSAISEACRRAG
jgi:hypothetical protein